MSVDATLIQVGQLRTADTARLVRQGAVGTMNGRFFDAAGKATGHLEQRTIALSWEELAAIPTVIAVAAGSTKVNAIAGAVKTGVIHTLITDEETAGLLLRQAT
jgi:DNA-binding transcriptional regulator LsrR (DeoR family)